MLSLIRSAYGHSSPLHATAYHAHEAVVARRPLDKEGVYLDGGRRTTQLMRDSLGGGNRGAAT